MSHPLWAKRITCFHLVLFRLVDKENEFIARVRDDSVCYGCSGTFGGFIFSYKGDGTKMLHRRSTGRDDGSGCVILSL